MAAAAIFSFGIHRLSFDEDPSLGRYLLFILVNFCTNAHASDRMIALPLSSNLASAHTTMRPIQ